ncbi:hypothetical protein [uncultured Maricaulis sp.]|uniref:hypothetical protein n=1 Tax=uncultured Maricaulis sp. TaxID=174710 RepID=UPI0030D86CA1|tara:strand:- start:129623 stop:130069 length:447 start_codon:yes stop_codon:yes gene_type:complete
MVDDAILSLEPIKRHFITLPSGKARDIYQPDELSVAACQHITRQGKRIADLSQANTADADGELEVVVDEVARLAFVDITDDEFTALSGFQKMQIVSVFTGLLLGRSTGLAGAIARTVSGSAGVKSSSGSSASSEAPPNGGGAKPRSAS